MTTRYTQEHYEDVARILNHHYQPPCGDLLPAHLAQHFADLFAADNPHTCCGQPVNKPIEFCTQSDKQRDFRPHSYSHGFNRREFLTACGLESEEPAPQRVVPRQILEHQDCYRLCRREWPRL